MEATRRDCQGGPNPASSSSSAQRSSDGSPGLVARLVKAQLIPKQEDKFFESTTFRNFFLMF